MKRERNLGALILLLTGVAALACRKPDYFPLTDKQEWRYAATEYEVVLPDTNTAESNIYVITVTNAAAEPVVGRVSELRITRDEEPYLSFFFRKTRNAVLVLPAPHLDGLEPTSGWVKLLELPLREGAFWYGDEEHLVSFEVMARETVELPMGRFRDCFRIRIHAPEPYLMDVWLAPDAGVIRWSRRFSSSRFEIAERTLR
jgi:hypothetical protein